ncbi:MAG: hypothetical protein ABI227_12335, partial [Rhodanobacter sp.]
MPFNRLTAYSVLAAALFVIAPVQATTSKTHGKSAPAKHVQHVKPTHGKLAHHKPAPAKHGKLAAATHKSTHVKSKGSVASVADTTIPTTANALAAVEMKSTLQANSLAVDGSQAGANVTPQLLSQLPIFNPAPMLSQSVVPASAQALLGGSEVAANDIAVNNTTADQVMGDEPAPAVDGSESATDLRKALIAMAMKMRDIRYVRGGHDPSTGFDCSGFVRYVFAHAIGMQ